MPGRCICSLVREVFKSVLMSMALAGAAMQAARADMDSSLDLVNMSLEELGQIKVTTVSKRPEPLMKAPASIYVITDEDIHRAGAVTLPDALRLAPTLEVARLDALSYAISTRGFNSTEASNKLLVLIDGRSVYSPLHSGVFWDAQDLFMDDIERIEVVGGPGGTLWGANAVNGVINIITKPADKTQGGLIVGSYGNVDRDIGARYGGMVGGRFAYRGYIKALDRGHSRNPDGTNHIDDWDRLQGGFNFNWKGENDNATLQGDFYGSSLDIAPSDVSGQNVLLRWTHAFADGSPLDVQAYYDRTHRDQPAVGTETVETYSIEIQHNIHPGARHAIIWGGGYRLVQDAYLNPLGLNLVHPHGQLQLGHAFVQDEISLATNLKATVGMKVEHHTYTGFEYMPNVRLAWQVAPQHLLWAAISRAVRTPSRIDRELAFLPILAAAPDFDSETLIAYEAGYRGNIGHRLTLSIAGYYNDYDDLRTTEPGPNGALPVMLTNGMEGHTYGVEIWAQYQALEWWRLSGGFTAIHKSLHLKPGVVDVSNGQAAGYDPSFQFSVRSSMQPVKDVDVDISLRVVDDLTDIGIPRYTEMDARIAWRATDTLELSLSGFNLLHDQHPEGNPLANRRELRRGFSGGARLAF